MMQISSSSLAFISWRLVPAALFVATAFLGAGCSDNPDEEVVKFETTPPGATVKIDGTPIGHTPMEAVLGRKRETIVTFEKIAFVTATIRVHPVDGDLTPNPCSTALRPDLLPAAPGADPQAELAKSLEVVHQYVAMGRISADDGAYIETCLRNFYTPSSTPAAASH